MVIYTYISFILLGLAILEICGKISHKDSFYIGAFLVSFILIFRGWDIGGDTDDYWNYFTNYGSNLYGSIDYPKEGIEIGFIGFTRLLHNIIPSGDFFIIVTSIVTLFPFIYLTRKNSTYKALSFLSYMTLWGLLTTSQTAIRQNLAVSWALIALIIWRDYKTKKIKKAIIVIIFLTLSVLSHSSMQLILPLLLIMFNTKTNRKLAIFFVFLSIYIGASGSYATGVFDSFYLLFGDIDTFENMTRYHELMEANGVNSFKILLPMTLLVATTLFLSKKDEIRNFNAQCLIWGCILYNIGSSFPLMFRITYAVLFVGITYTPRSINIKKRKQFISFIILIYIYAFIIIWKQIPDYNKGKTDAQMVPYTFMWEDNK